MLLVFCVSLGVVPAQAPTTPLKPIWEYKAAELDTGNAFRAGVGERLAKLTESLNKLGAEGWELVQVGDVLSIAGRDHMRRIAQRSFFRRPTQDQNRRQWVYKSFDAGDLAPGMSRGKEVDPVEKLMDRLSQESADGWELTTAFIDRDRVWGTELSQRYFLLKRPSK
jgi:hypothetical protein